MLARTPIYHITEIENLASIIAHGGLYSDAKVCGVNHQVIGYDHIKRRRLTELRVGCCGDRFVGEFVPFYFCPRSPMLYSINAGNTGKPKGHQREILHLVSSVGAGASLGKQWAISDGNAGAYGVSFYGDLSGLKRLDWSVINSNSWGGRTRQKCAEFLVADFFPWSSIEAIGCLDQSAVARVRAILSGASHRPAATAEPGWYYV